MVNIETESQTNEQNIKKNLEIFNKLNEINIKIFQKCICEIMQKVVLLNTIEQPFFTRCSIFFTHTADGSFSRVNSMLLLQNKILVEYAKGFSARYDIKE